MNNQSEGYGSILEARQIKAFIDHVFSSDDTPADVIRSICIWGKAGIGKTQLVKEFAREKGYRFAYLAPAQFEEMGDLHGMPHVVDGKTVYNPPEWVPTGSDTPGILLLDDFNRADERILRGIMQLFQNHGMMSWNLPANWKIICTANPDDGSFSVTTLDEAMMSRMMHITMKFDARNWAEWALKNGVDERGVDFVLTYPEIATGRMTNPRTLTSFFHHIRQIRDLKESRSLVYPLASAFLDKETAASFIIFAERELNKIVPPSEILVTKDFNEVASRIKALCMEKSSIRMDILSAMTTRLLFYLKENSSGIDNFENLTAFLLLDFLPNDLRTALHVDLVTMGDARITAAANHLKVLKLIVME